MKDVSTQLSEMRPQDQAALIALQQGRNWMLAEGYNDLLSGNQIKEIVRGLFDVMLQPIRLAVDAEMADGLQEKFPEISAAIAEVAQHEMERMQHGG